MGLALGLLYIFATLVRPQELFVALAPSNIMDILAALVVAGVALDVVMGRSRPSVAEPQVLLLVGFIGWASLTVVLVLRWFGGAWIAFEKLGISAFLFLALILTGTSMSRLRWLRRVMLLSMVLVTGLGLYSFSYGGPWRHSFVLEDRSGSETSSSSTADGGTGESPGAEVGGWLEGEHRPNRLRALGFLHDPNDLAQILTVMLPFALLGWRRQQWLRNSVLLVPASIFLYAIWLTHSRGGLLALAALVGFALSARYGGPASRLIDTLGWVAILALLVAFFRSGMADASALGRREAWSEGLSMLRSSPLWGAGYGAYSEYARVAHNSYIHCFGELGLVGYALWIGAIMVTLRQLDDLRRLEGETREERELSRWAGALRLSLISFLVSSLFLSRTYSPTLFLVLGLPTALAGVAHRRGYRAGPQRALPFAAEVCAASVGTVIVAYVVTRLSW